MPNTKLENNQNQSGDMPQYKNKAGGESQLSVSPDWRKKFMEKFGCVEDSGGFVWSKGVPAPSWILKFIEKELSSQRKDLAEKVREMKPQSSLREDLERFNKNQFNDIEVLVRMYERQALEQAAKLIERE